MFNISDDIVTKSKAASR